MRPLKPYPSYLQRQRMKQIRAVANVPPVGV